MKPVSEVYEWLCIQYSLHITSSLKSANFLQQTLIPTLFVRFLNLSKENLNLLSVES